MEFKVGERVVATNKYFILDYYEIGDTITLLKGPFINSRNDEWWYTDKYKVIFTKWMRPVTPLEELL